MKFEVEIECTPAEARSFLGLPDLTPLHEVWVERMKGMPFEGPGADEWKKLMDIWSSGAPGLADKMEGWQRMLWTAAGMAAPAKKE